MNKFGVDENGIIVTEVSADKITSQYEPVVADILDSIVGKFGADLDGIYLYGSVATGKAIEQKSDLDLLLVLKEAPNKELSEQISDLGNKLSEKYHPLLREVGFAISNLPEATSEKEKYGLMPFIKHLCICIYGNDLAKSVSGFKPSKELAKGFNGDIEKSIESSESKIEKATSESEIRKSSQALAKKIIRTGFSLVMPRSESWSTDLQISVDTFLNYYPEKAREINTALEWSKNGSSDKQVIINFINTFGQWLIKEFKEQIQ
jgi:predicted nucleotidyltransferase